MLYRDKVPGPYAPIHGHTPLLMLLMLYFFRAVCVGALVLASALLKHRKLSTYCCARACWTAAGGTKAQLLPGAQHSPLVIEATHGTDRVTNAPIMLSGRESQ